MDSIKTWTGFLVTQGPRFLYSEFDLIFMLINKTLVWYYCFWKAIYMYLLFLCDLAVFIPCGIKLLLLWKKLIQKFYFSILDWPKQLCYMLFNKMMKKLRLYWCTGYHGLYYIYKVAQTQCLFFHREVFLRWFNQPLVNCVM